MLSLPKLKEQIKIAILKRIYAVNNYSTYISM